jgi:pimeloyl-ACP methyl ester carboxylesterase
VAEPSLVERLVLVSLPVLARRPFGHTVDGSHRRLHRLAVHTSAGRALCTAGIGALAPAAAVVYPRLRPDLPPGAARDAVRTDWTAYWRTLEATVFAADVPALFGAVRAPVTILHGRDDLIAPVGRVRELAQSRLDVRYIELAAGHNPCYTSARAFYDLLSVEGEEALSRTAHALLRLVSAGRGRLVARIAAAR